MSEPMTMEQRSDVYFALEQAKNCSCPTCKDCADVLVSSAPAMMREIERLEWLLITHGIQPDSEPLEEMPTQEEVDALAELSEPCTWFERMLAKYGGGAR